MKSTLLALALGLSLAASGCGNGSSGISNVDESGDQHFPAGDLAGSHVLISFYGAEGADVSTDRSREEALELARELLVQVQADPSRFEELAREHSDGPSAPKGGRLGAWRKGLMLPAFEEAVESLEVGSISAEPVATPYGFHLIRRDSVQRRFWGANVFVIGFKGPSQVPPEVSRDRFECEELAESLKGKVTSENFEQMAEEYNDFGEGSSFLGVFSETTTGPSEIFDLLKNLDIGEVGGPVEFPVGFGYVKRILLEQRSGSHILVAWKGARNARADLTRSKEEAFELAQRLINQLKNDQSLFSELAMAHSDDALARQGGDMGIWFRGKMQQEVDGAIDDLSPGEVTSRPVESPLGYHVILRRPIPQVE